MSPRITALTADQSPDGSRPLLEQTQRALGMVPNLHRTLARAPAALRAYTDMVKALGGGRLGAPLREQIAVAIAALNGCDYCASAHTAIGKSVGIDGAELARNLELDSSDPKTAGVLAFVRALVETRGAVSDADLDAVRTAGFSDAELVEIVAHVGLNTFTNTINRLARTEIDFPRVEVGAAA